MDDELKSLLYIQQCLPSIEILTIVSEWAEQKLLTGSIAVEISSL